MCEVSFESDKQTDTHVRMGGQRQRDEKTDSLSEGERCCAKHYEWE